MTLGFLENKLGNVEQRVGPSGDANLLGEKINAMIFRRKRYLHFWQRRRQRSLTKGILPTIRAAVTTLLRAARAGRTRSTAALAGRPGGR